jgi:hypothetical protein
LQLLFKHFLNIKCSKSHRSSPYTRFPSSLQLVIEREREGDGFSGVAAEEASFFTVYPKMKQRKVISMTLL